GIRWITPNILTQIRFKPGPPEPRQKHPPNDGRPGRYPHPQATVSAVAGDVSFGRWSGTTRAPGRMLKNARSHEQFSKAGAMSFQKVEDLGSTLMVDEAGFVGVGVGVDVRAGGPPGGVYVLDFAAQRAEAAPEAGLGFSLHPLQVAHHRAQAGQKFCEFVEGGAERVRVRHPGLR